MKNYSEFQEYIKLLAAEFKDSGHTDAQDFAHEAADGSEYVIYYRKAWDMIDIVQSCNSELSFEGEEWAMGLGEKHESLDSVITSVAYGIVYIAVVEEVIRQSLENEAA